MADHVIRFRPAPELLCRFSKSFRCSCWRITSRCGAGCDVDQPRNLAKSVTVE